MGSPLSTFTNFYEAQNADRPRRYLDYYHLLPPEALFFFCTFISTFERSSCITDLPQALLINLSFGFFSAKMKKMSAAIFSKWAVFFTFWSIFCSSFSEFSPNFYHPSENSNFSGDSSWESHSILLLLLQLPSIRPGATETPLTSNSCPAASTAIACFLNFSVHQKKLISGAFRNAEKGKERCSSFGGAKKLCTLTWSLSLVSS